MLRKPTVWLVGLVIGFCHHARAADKPNFIFILSDDLAQGDLGCYGQKLIQTPNFDRMAAEGTRYLQAYCGTSVCAPSRSCLMTGLHTGHCPIRANREFQPEGQKPLPEGTYTVARLLKDHGYATACVGKWGMGMFDTTGSPLKVGFDHFYGYNCQRHAHSYFPTYLYNDDQRFELPGNDGKKQRETYAQNLIADEMLRWVREHQDEPFFLFHSVTLPHGKFEIDDQGIYKDQPWTEQQKNYAAMVTRLDSDVGRLLDLLRELGLDKNTLVITAGDNGSSFDPKSEIGQLFDQTMGGQLRGFKRGMYEGALRQAAIAWQPGTVPAGRVTEEPWAFWDYLPTVAELVGAKLPDSRSRSQFAIVVNKVDHPEVYRSGLSAIDDPTATVVRVDGEDRARWWPVATDAQKNPKIQKENVNGLTRSIATAAGDQLQLLILSDSRQREVVSGEHLTDAHIVEEKDNTRVLDFSFNNQGARQMETLTKRYVPVSGNPQRTHLAIILDGHVQSAPVILNVIGGQGRIAGNFTVEELDGIAAGIQHPTPLTDGHSLASFLKGGSAPQRDYFYWELHEGKPIQAARFGNWKAVKNGPQAPIELYDLATDIGEQHNVAQQHPDLVDKAQHILATARTEDPAWPMQVTLNKKKAK